MPIVKITGQGLSAIALSVALLWGCWIEERVVTRHASVERARVLRDLRQLQRTMPHPQPVFAPVPANQRTFRVTAG
jgi:hypothetical protein